MNLTGKLLAFLFVAAIPVLLITSNVRVAFDSVALYEFGFERHDVSRRTGLSEEQLSDAAAQIRHYFSSDSDDELLDLRVKVGQESVALFSQREIIHMRDVNELVNLTYRLQEGAFLFMFLFITLGFLLRGSDFAGHLRKLLIRGSVTTATLVAAIGLVSLVAFGPLFTLFHQLSFSNDFWQLDPARDVLVQLFPFNFWLEATVLLALASILEAGAIVGLVTVIKGWRERRRRIARSKVPQYI